MSRFFEFVTTALADRVIDDDEAAQIAELICQDGKADLDDVKLLVELYCGSNQRSPAFQAVFFQVLEQVFLADGVIAPSEQFYLLKMICAHDDLGEPEQNFLRRLQAQADRRDPHFDALCEAALNGEGVAQASAQ